MFTFDFFKWFYPGMHIKRWLALIVIGVAIMTFGLGYVVRELYTEGLRLPGFMYWTTLQFIPRYFRGAMFMSGAVGLILFSIWKLNQSIISVLAPNRDTKESLVNTIYTQRFLRRWPKIVAIGGGHGLSTLLRGLKEYTTNLTAIVTVADDGGSSGVLRRELGVLPPGDVRNCIAALADAEPLVTKLFQYRFEDGAGLAGHSFGNLFIVAMSGDTDDERTIHGESSIGPAVSNGSKARISEVYLAPENPPAHPEAVRAILEADLIVLGPGSLYTSVLPNLLVQGIRRSLIAAPAPKVYVCNVATQPGETDSFGVADHVAAIEDHVGKGVINYVLANDNVTDVIPQAEKATPVRVITPINNGLRLVTSDVVAEENRYHHDSIKLAEAIMRIYDDRDQTPQAVSVPEQDLVTALDGR